MPSDIRHIDWTLPSPAANLAADEALLEANEADQAQSGPGVLRFWESPTYFIVVGYAGRLAAEANLEKCASQQVPVLRRCSGGGTVVQGPGCLNYSLILPVTCTGPDASITEANRFVMDRQRRAVQRLLNREVSVAGHTDLIVGDRKFSGNAQRRRRDWFLFHGTFLLKFDLSRIEELLPPPPREPEYRQARGHLDFLTTLPVTSDALQLALREEWNAHDEHPAIENPAPWNSAVQRLVEERYGRDEWNRRW